MRVRLKGDGKATPVVRRVRLDFPRVTSLNYLPPVYRDNPEAEDFSERFLALFDASIGNLDRAIERAPALLDPEGVPDDVLPWLGSFLDIAFDAAWSPDLRRKILHALPDLYRRRGTLAGLREAIKLVFAVDPAIEELAAGRNWGSVAKSDGPQVQNAAYLGSVRLFGKSRARFRLNRSPLGSALLRSYGNPDDDPLLAQAFRFRVLVPPHSLITANARQRLEQLVASQKPAHALATIRFGGEGFHPPACLIGTLKGFSGLGQERIILASALMAHLRKRTNAQRLVLSTCKAGALPTELRPQVNLGSDLQKHLL